MPASDPESTPRSELGPQREPSPQRQPGSPREPGSPQPGSPQPAPRHDPAPDFQPRLHPEHSRSRVGAHPRTRAHSWTAYGEQTTVEAHPRTRAHSRIPTRALAHEAPLSALPRLTPRTFALVGVGAAIGASLRYALGSSLVANTLGTALLACLLTALALTTPSTPRSTQQRAVKQQAKQRQAGRQLSTRRRSDLRLLLGAGLCGGLTTYSTIMLDAVTATSLATAARQLGLDFACGLVAAVIGIVATRAVLRRRPSPGATGAPAAPAGASSPAPKTGSQP